MLAPAPSVPRRREPAVQQLSMEDLEPLDAAGPEAADIPEENPVPANFGEDEPKA